MRQHHKRTIERLIERFEGDPGFPAMIVAGLIAKGIEPKDSDVDIGLVLFGSRMILAHNRILYPYRKPFMHALRRT